MDSILVIPAEAGIHFFNYVVPCFRRDGVWMPAAVYPDGNRGGNDETLGILYAAFNKSHDFCSQKTLSSASAFHFL